MVRGSVIIPAHNESAVIARTLSSLVSLVEDDIVEVIVACNGCSDNTAAIAGAYPGIQVLETSLASKAGALRLADTAAIKGAVRIYLDADIVLPSESVIALLTHLEGDGMAARPPLLYEVEGASLPVRYFYEARSMLPSVLNSLWGAGVYALSSDARHRFGEFPDVLADDLWVDGLFADSEISILQCPPAIVRVPKNSKDLVRMLSRVYRGKELLGNEKTSVRRVEADLRRLAGSGSWGFSRASVYSAFAVVGRIARFRHGSADWARDFSSR